MSTTDWVLGQIAANRLANAGMPRMAYETLAKSLVAAYGGGQLFGMGLGSVDDLPRIRAELVAALVEYKAHYEAKDMLSWLFELDGFARRFAIAELRLTKRWPLRCDPLGARDALSDAWKKRLARLDTGQLALPQPVRFGERDDDALYREAVRFEHGGRATFPRELAAWWTTANGIFAGESWYLAPVADWRADELGKIEGLRIGAGAHTHLFLVGKLDKARVVETDDESVMREYKNFGELADQLLGGAS